MKLRTVAKEWLPLALVAAVGGSLRRPALFGDMPRLQSPLCSLLALAAAIMGLWIYYLYRQMSPKKFHAQFESFDARLGVWKHKTAPGYFCPRCKSELLGSPMVERKEGWQCPVCQTWASNPLLRERSGGTVSAFSRR